MVRPLSLERIRILMLAMSLLVVPAFARPAAAQASNWDGLQLHPSKKVSALYVRPGASLKAYSKVRIEPLQVAFAKDWKPNANTSRLSQKVSARDLERIKSNLAGAFPKAFAEELARGGYAVVTEPGEDVLTVVPFVVDLYITAPKAESSSSPGFAFVAEQGRMTLVAELRDSETGQVLARAVDKKAATQANAFQMSNEVTRSGAADNAIRAWARALRSALDAANGR